MASRRDCDCSNFGRVSAQHSPAVSESLSCKIGGRGDNPHAEPKGTPAKPKFLGNSDSDAAPARQSIADNRGVPPGSQRQRFALLNSFARDLPINPKLLDPPVKRRLTLSGSSLPLFDSL